MFWRCKCGHHVAVHGRTKFSGNTDYTYVGCRSGDCGCERYAASDGSAWPHGPAHTAREREAVQATEGKAS